MAEREGFEPSMGVKAHTPLAGERLQPLGHLSGIILLTRRYRLLFFHLEFYCKSLLDEQKRF